MAAAAEAEAAAAPAPVSASTASFLALEPRLQREFQQKVQRVRKNRAAKVSGVPKRGGGGLVWPVLACRDAAALCPAGGAEAGRGVRGAPPAGALRAADARVLRAVRDGDAAPALEE